MVRMIIRYTRYPPSRLCSTDNEKSEDEIEGARDLMIELTIWVNPFTVAREFFPGTAAMMKS